MRKGFVVFALAIVRAGFCRGDPRQHELPRLEDSGKLAWLASRGGHRRR